NGIKELETPIPRGVLLFLIATHIFAVLWWFLMPTWPLGSTYTKGLLGTDQCQAVERSLQDAAARRAACTDRINTESFDEIRTDPDLMTVVRDTGHRLFGDNCAACHGMNAQGATGYPDMTDDDWLWGGEAETIAEIMRVGINSGH